MVKQPKKTHKSSNQDGKHTKKGSKNLLTNFSAPLVTKIGYAAGEDLERISAARLCTMFFPPSHLSKRQGVSRYGAETV